MYCVNEERFVCSSSYIYISNQNYIYFTFKKDAHVHFIFHIGIHIIILISFGNIFNKIYYELPNYRERKQTVGFGWLLVQQTKSQRCQYRYLGLCG